MTLIAWLIYIPVQIIWLPFSILGVAWVAYKQLVVSKRLGVSQTAVEILNGRWTLDVFGLRDDLAARRIAEVIPNTSTSGLFVALFPLWLVFRLTGRIILYPTIPDQRDAGFANLVPSRSVEFDALIAANKERAEQFVVLGAGLDSRCYGPLAKAGLALFELDQAIVQSQKIAALKAAGIDASSVEFVAVDFARDDWISALENSTFDPDKPTIFLWEGVTLYLSKVEVAATLKALQSHAPKGSVVILDIYGQRFIELGKIKQINKVLESTGEELGFGLDLSNDPEKVLQEFSAAVGLTLGRHQFLGQAHKKGAFMVVAELVL